MRLLRAQGATEYLVLLAVVLIIALVGIALLGFFPGTASDAQITESKIYWQSATPIAITEWDARTWTGDWGPFSWNYLRIRNAGAYPIRITKVLGANNSISVFVCGTSVCGTYGTKNIRDYYYLALGDETYFAGFMFTGSGLGVAERRFVIAPRNGSYPNDILNGYSVGCQNSTSSPGTLVVENFGFEYIQYVEGQQITKRQIGTKPLIIKCREPY